jgi:hypothetical protein
MSGIMSMLLGAVSAAASTVDEFFNRVALLLNTSSTNGAQNNTFLDSSSNNYSITRAPASGPNAPTQGTFTPFSQTGWSGAFNTTTTYLTVTDTANLRFGSGNFTIEAWVYRNAAGAIQTIASKGASTPTGWVFQISAADKLVFTDTSTSITGATSLAANTWYYVAVVRAGTGASQTTLYVNGASDATGISATTFSQTNNMLIGADRTPANFANGFISNLRLSNTNRTISSTPTTALTADANTIFLALGINRFQYTNSTAAFTSMAVTGTPSAQAFSPFAPTAAYSTATVGGSGYFDGTGDYLTVADALPLRFGTGDFTISCWIYRNAAGAIHTIASKGSTTTGWSFQVTAANVLQFTYDTSTNITGSTTIPANAWTYVTVNRYFDSGMSEYYIDLNVNGTSDASSFSASVTDFNQTNILTIGGNRAATPANLFNGYIAGFEYIKGTAIVPTVPTAPPTTANSPSLLLNFTNSAIFNAASKLNMETVGTAQASTTQTKFGTTSLFINGLGNYIITPVTQPTRFGSADWTIELFFRTTTASTRQILLVWNGLTDASGLAACGINYLANNKIGLQISESGTAFKINDATTGLGSALSSNTWYYLAVTRSGATITVYIDGSSIGTYTLTSATVPLMQTGTTIYGTRNVIGASTDLGNQPFSGYIDELRVTNGVARTITSTPTEAFKLQ